MSVTTKFFEIRDSGTFIPVIATLLVTDKNEEGYLLRNCGYENPDNVVMVTRLNDCLAANDSAEWPNRTMEVAHRYIEDNFDSLESCAVIDVQFILGERLEPKLSQRLDVSYER